MSATVEIDVRQASALLSAAGPLTDAECQVIAAEEGRLVQRHLRSRDDSNAHEYPDGGRRSHFWRKAAESVTFTSDSEGISVGVTQQGVRLRYAGADEGIGPVNAGALAIPASAEAYGRLPSEFQNLRLVVFKAHNRAALVMTQKGEALGTVMFWLVKRTKRIPGDPTVLPPENVVLGIASSRLLQMRKRRISNVGQQ